MSVSPVAWLEDFCGVVGPETSVVESLIDVIRDGVKADASFVFVEPEFGFAVVVWLELHRGSSHGS